MTKDEFTKKVLSFERVLYATAMKMTKDKDDAEDLVQDTILKAVKHFHLFEDTNLKGWLMTVLRNTFINKYRRNKKRQKMQDDFYDVRVQQIADNRFPSPTSGLEVEEIYKGVKMLNSNNRQAFLLYVEGYQYEEIAEILNTPLGTVKSRIYFARKELMKYLK